MTQLLLEGQSMTEEKLPTIRELRERKHWSQTELAVHAGVSVPTISRLENNGEASKTSVQLVCRALGVNMDKVAVKIMWRVGKYRRAE